MRNLLATPLVLIGAIALALPACSDDSESVDVAIDDGETLGDALAAQAENELVGETDAIVAAKTLGILIAIDEGEILLADFALDNASDPIVLDYAQRMIDEHTAHLAAIDDLLFDLDLAPIVGTVSMSVDRDIEGQLRLLEASTDIDFAYMRSQVVLHTESVVIVDALIDFAPFLELAAFLETTFDLLEDHRDTAADILREL